MGDDETPGSQPPGSRAHWERYFSDPSELPGADPEPTLKDKIASKLPFGKNAPKKSEPKNPVRSRQAPKPRAPRAPQAGKSDSDSVSVSDLVNKVGGEAETDQFPKITDRTEPPTRQRPTTPPQVRRPNPPVPTPRAAPKPPTPKRIPPKPLPPKPVPPQAAPPQNRAQPPAPEVPATPLAERLAETPPAPAKPEVIAAPQLTRLALSKVRRKRRMRIVGRTTIAMFAVVALFLTGLVWGYLRSTDNGFAQVAALDENSTDVVDPGGQTGDETYLIVGTDSRAGKNSSVGAGTVDDAEGSRSDTVMLVNIPANRKRVVAVSFPRDLDVTRPVCKGWDNDAGKYTDETYPAAEGDKLNATYALGGPKCLVKVIQKMSGLKIGHFVGMDFSGFESMVNEVGGVEVCSSTPLTDGELGPILTKAGKQTVDGKTALNYVRARTIESEGNGDYGRIKRQQRFLSSLLRSALSNKVLLDPGKLNGFINAFTRDVFVQNVATKDLVMLGRSLQNVDAGAVTFLTVPTAGTTDYGNEIPRTDDITAIFKAIINDDPLPGEEGKDKPKPSSTTPLPPPPNQPVQTAVDPSSISLQVSNGSGASGMAATAADNFGSLGFSIYSVGNYSGTSTATIVRYSTGNEAQAETVASTIPGATLQESDDLGNIVEVVVGSDFSGKVKDPTPAGSPLAPVATQPSSTNGAPSLPVDLSVTNAADDSCS
ncbi:LCP family protein [Antrihabitans cavernicola]|uniref:LytR family transcriptional regulator n=1 Tax=Antrihabitans cavernicola TaxID=2495913 RepID=A0A5A7SB91_9NOCA|nr:LCP family protein [Spelaeibacter cavernicola]KAA0021843.1 LytR family transcriptional regulator [Spelaeibacter cavernicola]